MSDGVAHVALSQNTDHEVLDLPCTLPEIFHVNYVDLHAESHWDLANIPPSSANDVGTGSWADFTIIHHKCVRYSFEAPTTAADVFELALGALNTRGNQRGFRVWTSCTVPSSRPRHRYSRSGVRI